MLPRDILVGKQTLCHLSYSVAADAYPSPRMREKTVQSTGTPS